MFIWFIDNLHIIFASIMLWIFLSFAFAFTLYAVRKSYAQRNPMPWESNECRTETTGNLTE